MLPASKAASRPAATGTGRKKSSGFEVVKLCTAFLMTYTLVIGWGLLGNFIPIDRAYLIIAFACFIPAAGYGYGFVAQPGDRDFGLLLSSVGWVCGAIALLVQFGAVQNAYRQAQPGDFIAPVGTAGGTLFFTILSVIFILAGAFLSVQAWKRSEDTTTQM